MFQIFNKIFNWFFSNFREESISEHFEVITTTKLKHGLLKTVKRHTLLDVKTYIYTPYPLNTYFLTVIEDKDVHFYLDLVTLFSNETVTQLKSNNRYCSLRNRFRKTVKPRTKLNTKGIKKTNSHKITILKSSRWTDKNGKYVTEVLFSKEYDFIGKSKLKNIKNIDKYAIETLDYIVDLLNYRDIQDINFEWEINSYQKQIMSTNYLEHT